MTDRSANRDDCQDETAPIYCVDFIMAKRTNRKRAVRSKGAKTRRAAAGEREVKAQKLGGEIEVIARGVWRHGSRVLLCQHVKKGYYYLPGGHVEPGESAAAAAEREFLEETGERVRASDLMLVAEGVFSTRKRAHHEVNLVFHVEPLAKRGTGVPKVRSLEADIAFAWVDQAAMVDLDVRPLAVKAWLAAGSSEPGRIEWVSDVPRAGGVFHVEPVER